MTVSNTTNKEQYDCNGSTTLFAIDFTWQEDSEITVILTTLATNVEAILVQGTDYTLTGGSGESGSFTTAVAYSNLYSLTVVREVPLTQETDYTAYSINPAIITENALDKLTQITQQLNESIGRALKTQVGAEVQEITVVNPMAGSFLQYGPDGDTIISADAAVTAGNYIVPFAGAVERSVNAGFGDIVSVKDFGAVGDGVTDDTAAILNACAAIQSAGGGVLSFGRGKTYSVLPGGGSSGSVFYSFEGVPIILEGNGSKIKTGVVSVVQRLFEFKTCPSTKIDDMIFESGYTTLSSSAGIDFLVFNYGSKNINLTNIKSVNGRSLFVAKGSYVGEGLDSNRVSDINIQNLISTNTFYPINCQGAGDNLTVRGFSAVGCGRAYFAYNCWNHDIEVESNQSSPFTDALIKCYGSTDFVSETSGITLRYRSTGRLSGSGPQSAEEAFCAVDVQLHTTNPGPCFISDIDIDLNVDVAQTDTNANVFIMRKYNSSGHPDPIGSRGHQIIDCSVKVVGRNLQRLTEDGINFCNRTGDNWAGEYISHIVVDHFQAGSMTSSQNCVTVNGDGLSDLGFSVKNVISPGNLVRNNMTNKTFYLENCVFNAITSREIVHQSFTPTWTASVTNPVIGDGTLIGSYYVKGQMCTMQLQMTAGSTTTFGSGNWAFSLPIESKDTGGVPAIGSCLGLDSGTAFFTGACIINSSGTGVEVLLGNNVGNFTNDLTPFSWAQNDYLKLEITYPIE